MNWEAIVFFAGVATVFIGLPVAFVWSIKRSIRQDDEKRAKIKAENEAWLAEEKAKPKARLKVLVGDEIEIFSDDIEPRYERSYGRNWRYTSDQVAKDWALEIMKGAGFRKGVQHWPHQVIEKVTVIPAPIRFQTNERIDLEDMQAIVDEE